MEGNASKEGTLCEIGSDVLLGVQPGQTIKMKCTMFEGVAIWEEDRPSVSQHLKTEDIEEELKSVPTNIRKHAVSIYLSPFCYESDNEPSVEIFALTNSATYEIIISARAETRAYLIDHMHKCRTLSHEIGHIIDIKKANQDAKLFSGSKEWTEAMEADSKIKRSLSNLPTYFISWNAEESGKYAAREDFADSLIHFANNEQGKLFLKTNYPNRYKRLRGLLND
jgi:hypothetical protein